MADDVLMDVNWYLMPVKMQKHVPLMIAVGQINVYLRGFAETRCTREVFMKVTIGNCFNLNEYLLSESFEF